MTRQPDKPVPGDYYVRVSDPEGSSSECSKGTIVLVTHYDDEERVWYAYGKRHSGRSIDSFLDHFELDPKGAERVQSEISTLMAEVQAANLESSVLQAKLADFSPHLALPGEVSSADTERALTTGTSNMEMAKAHVASVRNQIAKFRLDMKQKQERLSALFEQQKTLLDSKVEDLNALVNKAQEAIWTINIYLGKDEQISQLRKGKPAPADTKITIRQLVLYMDEECAVSAEKGGIDFRQIDEFDKWVSKPANLQQVLPEKKGVVALKVRREEKKYGNDPWTDAAMNKANFQTYFLMRNGENIYRIWTDLAVTETLIPVDDEYSQLFFKREYNWDTREYDTEPVRPGDESYMKVMKQVDAKQRHYLRVLLFLQGLLDRTAVFHPLPAPRLNLLNRAIYEEHLVFITDAEKLLDTGRPVFDDWLHDINGKLDVGHRIIGIFDSYSTHGEFDRKERVTPAGATTPDDMTLHTIYGREDQAWIIRYAREGDIIWRNWGHESGPPKRRATCRLYGTDSFFINFDLAKVEDMEFYLQSRVNRHEYQNMFPLLKTCIELKKQEQENERPFRDLLVREIVKEQKVTTEEALREIDDLIYWWKFKNKTHRALVASDDAKALRMIVREFGIRRERENERCGNKDQWKDVIDTIRTECPDVIYIGHKAGKEFAAFVPHNGENVFVREQVWKLDEVVSKVSEKEWTTVDKRRLRWQELYAADRWTSWRVDVRAQDFLTDPERQQILDEIRDYTSKKIKDDYFVRRQMENFDVKPKDVWLYAGLRQKQGIDHAIDLWVWCWDAIVSEKLLLSSPSCRPGLVKVKIKWERTGEGIKARIYDSNAGYEVGTEKPWSNQYNEPGTVIFEDQQAYADMMAQNEAFHAVSEQASDLRHKVNQACRQLARVLEERFWDKEKAAFLAEYGDEALWEDHKKTVRTERYFCPDYVESAFAWLVERHVDINWLMVGSLIKRARLDGWKSKKDEPYDGGLDEIVINLEEKE